MTGSFGGFEVVAEVGQAYEAELIALRLRDASIEATVLDQSYRQEPLPSVRSFAVVRVLVPADQLEKAKQLLAEGVALPEGAEDGETMDGQGAPEARRE
jgi:Putative prokaryotic signal transducing protein